MQGGPRGGTPGDTKLCQGGDDQRAPDPRPTLLVDGGRGEERATGMATESLPAFEVATRVTVSGDGAAVRMGSESASGNGGVCVGATRGMGSGSVLVNPCDDRNPAGEDHLACGRMEEGLHPWGTWQGAGVGVRVGTAWDAAWGVRARARAGEGTPPLLRGVVGTQNRREGPANADRETHPQQGEDTLARSSALKGGSTETPLRRCQTRRKKSVQKTQPEKGPGWWWWIPLAVANSAAAPEDPTKKRRSRRSRRRGELHRNPYLAPQE